MHLDNLLFILLIAMAALFRLLASQAGDAKKRSQKPDQRSTATPQPDQPIRRAPVESDEERIRKFLEAIGQPATSRPPPPVVPRTNIPPRRLAPVHPPPIPTARNVLARTKRKVVESTENASSGIDLRGSRSSAVTHAERFNQIAGGRIHDVHWAEGEAHRKRHRHRDAPPLDSRSTQRDHPSRNFRTAAKFATSRSYRKRLSFDEDFVASDSLRRRGGTGRRSGLKILLYTREQLGHCHLPTSGRLIERAHEVLTQPPGDSKLGQGANLLLVSGWDFNLDRWLHARMAVSARGRERLRARSFGAQRTLNSQRQSRSHLGASGDHARSLRD